MSLRILHISDVHFGTTEAKEGKPSASSHFIYDKNEIPMPEVLADVIIKKYDKKSIDLIVDSGDLVWKGRKNEYNFSNQFWNKIRRHFGEIPIVIVPGNHDVDVQVPNELKKQNDFLEFVKKFYGSEFRSLYPVYNSKNRHSIATIRQIDALKVLVTGVNSAAAINETTDEIFIDENILADLGKKISKLKAQDYFKIFVIHHHLFPFFIPKAAGGSQKETFRKMDKSMVINSARLQNWLSEHGFHMVLHGHQHQLHGRVEYLWHYRSRTATDRRMIILGGGSAGVYNKEMYPEYSRTINEIVADKLSDDRYRIGINTCEILDIGSAPPYYQIEDNDKLKRVLYTADSKKVRNYFESSSMNDCHARISAEVPRDERIYNFISIVNQPDYVFPAETCKIGNRSATQDEIIRSFQSLHPEYIKSRKWDDPQKIKKSVKARENNYSINHGSRIFGGNHLLEMPHDGKISDYFPINSVVKQLKEADGDSKGYISLFNYDIDVKYRSSALPGLMGIQLVRKETNGVVTLDIVATFRTIELSFWWVVNMYELIQIQQYALLQLKRHIKDVEAGSITFFAAMAKWKKLNLNLTIEPRIETLSTDEIFKLVSDLKENKTGAVKVIKDFLLDFRETLSEINISFYNLEKLFLMLKGINRKTPFVNKLCHNLELVCSKLDDCIEKRTINDPELKKPKELLTEIIDFKIRS